LCSFAPQKLKCGLALFIVSKIQNKKMANKVTKIAVLTSGGDAPGMNAAIRSVVRTGVHMGLEVFGIKHGYSGMLSDDIFPMTSSDVTGILQHGGTILKTARCEEFFTPEGRAKAFANLQKRSIDGLVVIGGNGSFTGGMKLEEEFGIPVIGVPGTIDNDLYGTDYTIGFDTAVNTAVEAIDKIRDTAEAHERLFVIEVMGRHAGYLALHSGIATGAEHILIPEVNTTIGDVVASLTESGRRKRLFNIIVVAEGYPFGGGDKVAKTIQDCLPNFDTRVTILGHIQRGGSPTCADRILASRIGFNAVKALVEGTSNVMVGIIDDKIVFTPLETAIVKKEEMKESLMGMIKVLNR
jgi:6-phosphofructokinase 1